MKFTHRRNHSIPGGNRPAVSFGSLRYAWIYYGEVNPNDFLIDSEKKLYHNKIGEALSSPRN